MIKNALAEATNSGIIFYFKNQPLLDDLLPFDSLGIRPAVCRGFIYGGVA